MDRLTSTTRLIDLHFLGRTGIIGTAIIETAQGLLLVDPGPSSCLARLTTELREAGVAPQELHGLLLTHIHLDHAGASGSLVREFPHLMVYVHGRGAPHMADPSKLVTSAERLYGEDMDRLWGEIAPVPGERIRPVAGGDVLDFGPLRLRVAYTPGHASHHVSYLDDLSGIAYTGDIAGIRIGSLPYALPPTPPPDIDLEAWLESLDLIRGWQPAGLLVTHFGLKTDVGAHLDLVTDEIEAWGRISRGIVTDGATGPHAEAQFVGDIHQRVADRVGSEAAATYAATISYEHCWMGLSRYWKKRGTTEGVAAGRVTPHHDGAG